MALTREDGVRAGMLLLIPENWAKVSFEGINTPVSHFLQTYTEDCNAAIGDGFSWSRCSRLLMSNGIEVTEDEFEEHYDAPDKHAVFFDTMFQTMLHPPVSKPLEDWL